MKNKGIKYEAVLFAPDGECVRDYRAATPDDVWELVNDGGSKWFFYPFPVVVRYGADKKKGVIIAAPVGYNNWKGRTLGTLAATIKEAAERADTSEEVFDSI